MESHFVNAMAEATKLNLLHPECTHWVRNMGTYSIVRATNKGVIATFRA